MRAECVNATFVIGLVWCLAMPAASMRAQSPSSIGGRTIQLTISSGSGPFASSGAYRFLPSATDNSYAIVPISGQISASFGTHTYTKSGPSTAQLDFTDSLVGVATADCTFTTTNSGTYILSGVSFPGSTQTGTFFLYSGASPASIAGLNIVVTVTSGAQPFAASGIFQFLPTVAGGAYTIIGRSGVADSSGTCSYIQNSTLTGIISFADSISGVGFSSQLSFDSETTGTIFLRQTAGAGYQTGTFAMASPGTVVTWGNNSYGLANVPVAAQSGVTAIAAGVYHSVVLKNDGSVVAWGRNDYGQTNVPLTGQGGVVAIAAGYSHTVALKTNGAVVAWGYSGLGQTNVPIAAQSGVAAIGAGNYYSLALKTNGVVVAWGGNTYGESIVPVAAQSGVTALAGAWTHTVALKTNGAVVVWGAGTTNSGVFPNYGQSIVPNAAQSGVTAVAAGAAHTVALKTNGTVLAWGAGTNNTGFTPNSGQSIVPAAAQNGVKAIAAGYYYTLALKITGSVVAWGANDFGQSTVPVTAQSGVTAISARYSHALALVGSGLLDPVTLSARQNGKKIILSWPTTAVGFKLQSAPNLMPGAAWLDLTNVPVIVGAEFAVTNAATGSSDYFRLRRP